MKKQLWILTILLCVCLSACGGQTIQGKSDSEIAQDIQLNDARFSDYGLIIESFAEIKRQTNPEDKTDYVWFEVNASNHRLTYRGTYELCYVLYNDGWQVEDFSVTSVDISPLSYPTEEMASAAMQETYPGCEFLSCDYDYDKNTVQFLFKWAETAYYATTVYDVTLDYTFHPRDGWSGSYQKSEHAVYPDIVGQWRYEEQNTGEADRNYTKSRSYYINILSCSGEIVQFEYDLSTVEHRRRNTLEEWHDEERREKSNGPIEAKLICTQSKNEEYVYYISYDIPAFPTIWMYLGTGTLDHRQAGPSIDGCVLTKVS